MPIEPEASRAVTAGKAEDTHATFIGAHLDRVLRSSAFKNSQRSSKLIRYLVERTLHGETDLLKERLLGTTVFGRSPDYDTSTDHIVRSTAGEIRRRLAQYYLQPATDDGVRIELLPGSYVPQFRSERGPAIATQERPSATERMTPLVVVPETVWPERFRLGWTAAAMAVVLLAALGIGYFFSLPGPEAKFWGPLLNSPNPVAICVGDPRTAWAASEASAFASFPVAGNIPRRTAAEAAGVKPWFTRTIPFGDAVTVSRLGALVAKQNKDYRIVYSPDSTLSDLRQNAAVLVGGIDNFWTMHLTRELRYRFQLDLQHGVIFIEDQKMPLRRNWQVPLDEPRHEVSVDYALVARLIHPVTGRPVVIAGGIRDCGTLAAGEFLTSSSLLEDLERRAPSHWSNVEAVIATRVFRNAPGTPEVVAAYFW